MTRGRLAWVVALGGALAAGGCGDDGGGMDGGTEAGTDTGTADSGGDGAMDGGADGGTPLPSCDPFGGAGECADGEKCSVVLEFDDAGDFVRLFFGCVPAGDSPKAEGVPCGRRIDPIEGGSNLRTDDCQDGLFCFVREGAAFNNCQRLCLGDMVDCGEGDFCQLINDEPAFGVCAEADGCDPALQTGCSDGEACYVRTGTNGDVLGHCSEPSLPDGGTGAVGEPCMFLNSCVAGAQCRVDTLPDGGPGDTTSCRALCAATLPDGGTMDGGVPDGGADGGSGSTGECPSGTVCDPLEPPEGAMVRTPTPPGFCVSDG